MRSIRWLAVALLGCHPAAPPSARPSPTSAAAPDPAAPDPATPDPATPGVDPVALAHARLQQVDGLGETSLPPCIIDALVEAGLTDALVRPTPDDAANARPRTVAYARTESGTPPKAHSTT